MSKDQKIIESIVVDQSEVALVIRTQFDQEGIKFFTNETDEFQLGFMRRETGHVIKPHRHKVKERVIKSTSEVLFLKQGKVRVDFYDNENDWVVSCQLQSGDVILLKSGAHGFEVIEEAVMIEVKQGPFFGLEDKEHIQ